MSFFRTPAILILIPIFVFLLTGCSSTTPEYPQWVRGKSGDSRYYTGVGFAPKSGYGSDHIRLAKERALADLSTEISVTITSTVHSESRDVSGEVESEFLQKINTYTNSVLSGYEVHDSWETEHEFWVLYRLDKEKFRKQQERRLRAKFEETSSLHERSGRELTGLNITSAMRLLLTAHFEISKFPSELYTFYTDYDEPALRQNLHFGLQKILDGITLKPDSIEYQVIYGKPVKRKIKMSVQFEGADGRTAVSDLPLSVNFIKGKGTITGRVKTDEYGSATALLSGLQSNQKLQIIESRIDLGTLLPPDSTSAAIKGLSKFSVPAENIILNVKGAKFLIDTYEYNHMNRSRRENLLPVIAEHLTQQGFEITKSLEESDLKIDFYADLKQGGSNDFFKSVKLSIRLIVTDIESGEEVYTRDVKDIKGSWDTWENAGKRAIAHATDLLKTDILPEMIEHLSE